MIIKLNDLINGKEHYIAIRNFIAQRHLLLPLLTYNVVDYLSDSIKIIKNLDLMPEQTKRELRHLVKAFTISNRYWRMITNGEFEYVKTFLAIDKDMPLGLKDLQAKIRFEVLYTKMIKIE